MLVIAAAAACGSTPKTDCNDGLDNDGDGFIDSADPGCELNDNVTETPDPSQCNDGLDNDGDMLVDLTDYGCDDGIDDDETDPVRACNNGLDDDNDGNVDYPMDTGCENPVDNDEFNPAACQDFADNDGDAFIDYPYDPGCDSPEDDDEVNASLTACSDGADNDMDGFTDYPTDPGCNSAADNDEFNTIVGACGPSLVITDISGPKMATGSITMALPNELQSDVCHGYGGEFAYTYQVTAGPVALLITTDYPETTLDTVVYLRTECRRADTELGCDDDGGDLGAAGRSSTLLVPLVETGTYYVIVDAFGPGSLGDFKVTVSERNPLHGACDIADPNSCIPGLICRPFMPGDPNTCEYHVCNDTLDNDGDGVTDYPFEPGCTSILDDDEANPSPLPLCGNGLDDDGDSFIDYPADVGCEFAADNVELNECYPGKPVNFLDPVLGVTGTTAGASNVTTGTCLGGGGADSSEVVYALTPTVPLNSLTLSTNNPTTTYDTALYVRDDNCATGAEVACNNDVGGGSNKSTVTFTPTTGHTYFVFVDGTWSTTGTFHIDVSGVISPGGACDPSIPTFACSLGYACRESTPGAVDWQCRLSRCNDTLDNDGDGTVDWPNDPGCATLSGDNEVDDCPAGPGCPECSDDADNDGDGLTDYGPDLGCISAGDNNEVNDCVPGEPVIDHPGGTVLGDTTGGPSLLGASAVCDSSGTSATVPERVYVYHLTQALTSLHFDTVGSAIDTVLYVRFNDCSVAGPDSRCNDDGAGTQSLVDIAAPPVGYYYAVVDGKWGAAGAIALTITGTIAPAGACVVGDPSFVCGSGYLCTGTCTPTQCNDTVDNDGDADVDFPFEPGCTSLNDNDETDPVPTPQCGDGLDNDGDGMIDYPADSSCGAASDDNEACAVFGTDTFGYSGCTDTPGIMPCDDITTTGAIVCSGDDCTLAVALPFTFEYYGVPQTTATVSSNGKIGFPATTSYSNSCTLESNTIAAYWDDLYAPSGGTIRSQTLGTMPNRRFVVNWHVPHISGGTQYDIRAVLYEGSNNIDFCYVDTVTLGATTDSGASATVGIQGPVGMPGLQYSCNSPVVTNGLAVHYTHP